MHISSIALCLALLATTPATSSPQAGATEEPDRTPAQEQGRTDPRVATAALSSQDRSFVEQAARGGVSEVEEAKLAQTKAQREEVKESAARLEADHKAANSRLEKIAKANGIAVPKDPPPERKAVQDKLRTLEGEQFDREYVSGQIAAHEKTIALFENQGARSSNPEIAAFARDSLPTLKHHLHMMRELQRK